MKNNFTLEDYRIIKGKTIKLGKHITVLILIIIGLLIICSKVNFKVYEKYSLIKDNDNFIMVVSSNKLKELEDNNTIYINSKEYKYEIVSIDFNYSNINDTIFQSISIKLLAYDTNAIVTDAYLLKSDKNLYQMFVDFIEGGIG